MSLPLIELWVYIKMVKGTKLDVAFLNTKHHIFLFEGDQSEN